MLDNIFYHSLFTIISGYISFTSFMSMINNFEKALKNYIMIDSTLKKAKEEQMEKLTHEYCEKFKKQENLKLEPEHIQFIEENCRDDRPPLIEQLDILREEINELKNK